MSDSTPALVTRCGVIFASENPANTTCRRRINPVAMTALASLAIAGVYSAYHRIGTTANADTVEYTPNLAGGFLAVGMTEDQPGFILLSALDREKIDVKTTQSLSRLAGVHTVVAIRTPRESMRTRLRGPQVIVVSADGRIERHVVDWTVDEFNALRAAADCSFEASWKKQRCGAPFTDMQQVLADWPIERVPERVLAFLVPFKNYGAAR